MAGLLRSLTSSISNAFSVIASYTNTQQSTSGSEFDMTPFTDEQYAEVLARARESNRFTFLDLPYKVRIHIYRIMFFRQIVTVCSYNKDHTDPNLANGEVCQILLTNKKIFKEARVWMYAQVNWTFTKIPSIDYFVWCGRSDDSYAHIQKVTLTQTELIPHFAELLKKFPKLTVLVLDVCEVWNRKARLIPKYETKFCQDLKAHRWYAAHIMAHLPTGPRAKLRIYVTIHITWKTATRSGEEIVFVDCKKETVIRSFRRVRQSGEELEHLLMPSAQDGDAEDAADY